MRSSRGDLGQRERNRLRSFHVKDQPQPVRERPAVICPSRPFEMPVKNLSFQLIIREMDADADAVDVACES